MNGYTCIKALALGGIGYTAGSNIPVEAVLPGRVRTLIKQGYISPATDEPAPVPAPEGHAEAIAELQGQIAQLHAEAEAAQAELQQVISERDELKGRLESTEEHTDPAKIVVPLTKDGGVLEVPADPDTIVAVMCNLQLTAEESTRTIETMTNETALILIHALDGRKTVKTAAEARAKKLESDKEESGEGQGTDDA